MYLLGQHDDNLSILYAGLKNEIIELTSKLAEMSRNVVPMQTKAANMKKEIEMIRKAYSEQSERVKRVKLILINI